MSSEQEEGADHPDEPNAIIDANVDQSADEKGNGPREHAKPRRRRRGKKRKHKKESAAAGEAENPEECESEMHAENEHCDFDDSPEWGSDENAVSYYDTLTDVIIRPVNVPKAPLNSTQFIMDDHDDCRFYMSFETPNPYGESNVQVDREEGDIIEPVGEDAAYIDIDYVYESPQDFDNSSYYDKEFENSYKNSRFEELMRQSRADLIKKVELLESRLKELSEDLVKENPSPVLEKLQAELLELQEKNSCLKENHAQLTAAVLQTSPSCSESVTSHTLVTVSNDEHDTEDSEREVYEECNEMLLSDNESNVCDKTSDSKMDEDPPVDHDADSEQFGDNENQHHDQSANTRDCVDQPVDDDVFSNPTEKSNDSEKASNLRIERIGEDIQQVKLNDTTDSVNHSDKSSMPDNGTLNVTADNTIQSNDSSMPDSGKLSPKSNIEQSASSSADVVNTDEKISKHVRSNSHVSLHCQPNNLVHEDLRTLNIISSELFHNASQTKCSSSVPKEGGMSPSETSVN